MELLDKEELLAWQITYQFINKLCCFWKNWKKIAFQKQPIFLLNEEVIWQASDSSLSNELHGTDNTTNS